MIKKTALQANITALLHRYDALEKREQQYISAAAAFEQRLNIIDKRTSDIKKKYEKIIEQNRDILNSHDVLRKEFAKLNNAQDAYVTWLKNLGGRLNEIEKNKF